MIVPKGSKSFCHDEKTGHFGVRKTFAKVWNGYYWEGLQKICLQQLLQSVDISPSGFRQKPFLTKPR